MHRYLDEVIHQDLLRKIILISGPRQCGKTTLAKSLGEVFTYLNYDSQEDRQILLKKTWDPTQPLVIFDELHKMAKWKQWLKGLYDTRIPFQPTVVTGSARLDIFRRAGDSLAGRFFQFHLHPLDLEEIRLFWKAGSDLSDEAIFRRFWESGPFPDPFLNGDPAYYRRWRSAHLDIVLRQDVQDLSAVRDIQTMETLVALLRERVGSPISVLSLARDLQKDPNTIRRWLELLESLYVLFKVTPYHRNVARSLLKEPKYYFYDFCQVSDDPAKFENIIAAALLKKLQFIQDTQGYRMSLHYVRTRDGRELDFLVLKETQPFALIEVKWGDSKPSPNFKTLAPFFEKDGQTIHKIQIVRTISQTEVYPSGVQVVPIRWLFSQMGEQLIS